MKESAEEWRRKTSFTLGKILENQKQTNTHLEKINGTLEKHEERLDNLDEIQSNKLAVRKFLAGLWAIIGGAVVWILSRLWEVLKG